MLEHPQLQKLIVDSTLAIVSCLIPFALARWVWRQERRKRFRTHHKRYVFQIILPGRAQRVVTVPLRKEVTYAHRGRGFLMPIVRGEIDSVEVTTDDGESWVEDDTVQVMMPKSLALPTGFVLKNRTDTEQRLAVIVDITETDDRRRLS